MEEFIYKTKIDITALSAKMETFSSSISYNKKLKQDIVNLLYSILNEKDISLCNELLLDLADNFTFKGFVINYKKENLLIKKAKEMRYYELDDILNIDEVSQELSFSKFQFIKMFKSNTKLTPLNTLTL